MTLRIEKIQQIIACYLADAKRKLHHTGCCNSPYARLWIAFYVWQSGKRKARERAGRREGCRKHVGEEKTGERERMLMKNVFGQEPAIQKKLNYLLSHLIASGEGSRPAYKNDK